MILPHLSLNCSFSSHKVCAVTVCVCVCVCFGAVSQRAWANRLLMEAGLETAEGIFVYYIYTVTSTRGGLQLI